VTAVLRVLSHREAERLTDQIKFTVESIDNGLFKLRNLLEEAQGSNVWQILGFSSWTAYLASLFEGRPVRLAREDRQELVGYLSGEGMSSRAIAPIVGASVSTVKTDMQVANLGQLDRSSAGPALTEALTAPVDDAPRPVTGLDGKTYSRPVPPSAKEIEAQRVAAQAAREQAEAARAEQQEWNAFRDLYSGLARSVSSLASYATHDPARLWRHFEDGMFTPVEEREFTPERMRAAVTTLQRLIEWKESQ
jgi:hypothetical protein